MLDTFMRKAIDRPLNQFGAAVARTGISANAVTLTGLIFGLAAATLVAMDASHAALIPLALCRLADGLDGAVARSTQRTDFGGFLDITADFIFYGVIPVSFIIADPELNAIPGAVLLLSFYVNGASFLGFAILAEKRGITTSARGIKNLYYSGGLLEGTETIAFFVLICLFPDAFAPAAWTFGGLCFLTTCLRIRFARKCFPDSQQN